MHRHQLRLAAGLLTFPVGASLAGPAPDCFCASAECRVVFAVDHPAPSLLHPFETIEMLWAARWRD